MGKVVQLIALILLPLVCTAVIADCHGDCAGDSDSQSCCHACTHAVISSMSAVRFDHDHQPSSCDNNSSIPLLFPDGVFQPPESAI